MISIVIPGRNDSFGYNSHKRVAISLNCFAAWLRSANDEIIFVDCNTPNNLPTLPEAIADTLTAEAKARLRILRIRPELLENVGPLAVEGIQMVVAHNVGLRRADPANRWVAATTSDHIIMSRDPGENAADILERAADGYYSLPRYEIPQLLWEEFERSNPEEIFLTLREAAENLHLREGIFDSPPVEVDNCGDFQLMLRSDLFAVSGLDERMVTGWPHTDANLHVRLRMLRGFSMDLNGILDAYHCSHQRSNSTTQSRKRIEHDWTYFVSDVKSPFLPHQKETWGLADATIEEIRLDSRSARVRGLVRAIGTNQRVPLCTKKNKIFDAVTYPVSHVVSHVADQLVSFPSNAVVGYLGANRDMAYDLTRLMEEWHRPPLLVSGSPFGEWQNDELFQVVPTTTVLELASVVVVDFSVAERDSGSSGDAILRADCSDSARRALSAVEQCWLELVNHERGRISRGCPRRAILALNAIHTSYEEAVTRSLIDGITPFSTRTRAGVIRAPSHAGRPTGSEVFDYVSKAIGWRASPEDISYALTAVMLLRTGTPSEMIPQRMLGAATAALLDLPQMQHDIEPEVISAVRAKLAGAGSIFGNVVLGQNFLAHQSLIEGAVREGDAVMLSSDVATGIAVFGPYIRLPPGRYIASATFAIQGAAGAGDIIRLEVATHFGSDLLGEVRISEADCKPSQALCSTKVGFHLNDEQAESKVEVRIWRLRKISMKLTALVLNREGS